MLNKSNEWIAISLSDDVLKVAYVKGTANAVRIVNALAQNVKGLTEENLFKTVQSALRNFPTKTTPVCLAISSSLITTKNIEIPSIDHEEIKSIVNLQAGRHTPFSREEIQIGYINIGVYKSNYTKVLLVIANRAVLKKQLGLMDKAGIKVEKVLFVPEGVAAFYSFVLGVNKEHSPVGIIDVGKETTEFIVTLRGAAIVSRHIPMGKADLLKEGAPAREKLLKELEKTIESYQGEDIEQPPTKYILTSDDKDMKEIQDALRLTFKWVVDIVPYVDHVKVSSGVLKHLGNDHSFLDVVSSCVKASDAEVNLMPEDVQIQKTIEAQGKELFKTAILGFILLILVAGIFGVKIYFKNAYLDRLKKDYKGNREEVMALEQRSIETRIIQNYLSSRLVSLDIINELYKNVPTEMYLTNIYMDDEGRVIVQGISDIASLVFNLGTVLKESPLFKSVDIKSMTAKKDRGKDVSSFEIELKQTKAFVNDESSDKIAGKE